MSLLARLGTTSVRANCLKLIPKDVKSAVVLSATKHTGTAQEQIDAFFQKNKDLRRPMTPHLTIYDFKMPVLLSGTHRATGFALALELAVLGAMGTVIDFNTFIGFLQGLQTSTLGAFLVYDVKFCVVFPLFYHSYNGLRHLAWDAGYGFKRPDLWKTGYFVLALSLICTFIVLGNPLKQKKPIE